MTRSERSASAPTIELDEKPDEDTRDFLSYYAIKPPKSSQGKREKPKSKQGKTMLFRFEVGGKTIGTQFYEGRGFKQLTLQEKIWMGIGQSSTCEQEPEQQYEQIFRIAGKFDEGKSPFAGRFKRALKKEIDQGRVVMGIDDRLALDESLLEPIEAAIDRTKRVTTFNQK